MSKPNILVVDDEIAVLKYMVTILTRHGYEVHSASDASAALQLVEQLSCGLNLLITDVAMPGVSGDQLVRSLRRMCPYVDVLVVSGALQEGNKGLVNCPVLKKPFLPTALTAAVNEILSRQIH
jgi:DNA-binding response OmpR family regulator